MRAQNVLQIAQQARMLSTKLEFQSLSHAVGETSKAGIKEPADTAAGPQPQADNSSQIAAKNASMARRNVLLHTDAMPQTVAAKAYINPTHLRKFSTTTNPDIADIYKSIDELFQKGATKREYEAMRPEIEKQITAISASFNVTAEQRLAALKLKQFVRSLDMIAGQLVRKLEIQDGKKPSLAHIFNPEHLNHIRASTCQRLADSEEIRRAMPLAELKRLGIDLSPSAGIFTEEDLAHCAKLEKGLSAEQAMALTAYTHQDFHIFNVLNLIHRFDGVPTIKKFFEALHQLIFDAQVALRDNPDFQKTNITLFKGLHAENLDELRNILEKYHEHLREGRPFSQNYVMSSTADAFQSYVSRPRYDVELRLTGVTATAAHFFNHQTTADEMEYLIARGTEFEVVPNPQQPDRFETRDERRRHEGWATVYTIELKQISNPIDKIKS